MVRDDRGDLSDNTFDKIERMMNGMTGDDAGLAPGTHIDVYDEGSTLQLTADLPGVDKDAVDPECDGETLTVSATGDRHEYGERTRLPTRVDEHSVPTTFSNGVLQVTFDRAEDSAAIDVE